MTERVYLDYNATTALAPVVLEAMLPWFSRPANPSSRHDFGRRAEAALRLAREQVAQAVGAHPTEIVFTSGGSEANNLLLKGVVSQRPQGLLLHSVIEHPSVYQPARQLARMGWSVREIPVDNQGRVLEEDYQRKLTARPAMVSIMMANNETGLLQDIGKLASLAAAVGAGFHSDAVQALGKIPVDFESLQRCGVSALSISGHKIHGPQGIGALIVDRRLDLAPLIAGGGQERGLRSGTENMAAIVGFGLACERLSLPDVYPLQVLREQLETALLDLGATIFALEAERLPNTVFFAFDGLDGETLVAKLDRAGFAVASGSACSSVQAGAASHVLRAMRVDEALAKGAVRVSLGRENTAQEIERFVKALAATIQQLQTLTAVTVTES